MNKVIVSYGGKLLSTLGASAIFRSLFLWSKTKVKGVGRLAAEAGLIALIAHIMKWMSGDDNVTDCLRDKLKARSGDRDWSPHNAIFLQQVNVFSSEGADSAAMVMQAMADCGITVELPDDVKSLLQEADAGAAIEAGISSLILEENVQRAVGDKQLATATTSPIPQLFKAKRAVYQRLRNKFDKQTLKDLQQLMFNIEAGDWDDLEEFS